MKKLIIILALLASGCASTIPSWQQELNSLNREWRDSDPVVSIEQSNPAEIRAGYSVAGMMCSY